MLEVIEFFFNNTASTEIYTLSLHDALPIYRIAILNAGEIVECGPPSQIFGAPRHEIGRASCRERVWTSGRGDAAGRTEEVRRRRQPRRRGRPAREGHRGGRPRRHDRAYCVP